VRALAQAEKCGKEERFIWQFLEHKGSSNLAQQQALLRPVFRLLKSYEIVVIGDREFRSVELAYWLKQQKVYFALRLKQGSYIKLRGEDSQKLKELGLVPGMKLFLTGVKLTKKRDLVSFLWRLTGSVSIEVKVQMRAGISLPI
jgi:hypothetical protein